MNNDPRPSRLGPIESAIRDRDRNALHAALHARAVREEGTGCLRWTGNKRPQGYGMTGRGRTNHLCHRLVAWSQDGFPGAIRDYPPVAHLCGTRDCIEPSHLAPTTSLLNTLEARVRKTLVDRIKALEAVIRASDPDHPILDTPPLASGVRPMPRAGDRYESPAERIRRWERRERQAEERRHNRIRRHRQVLEVRRLVAAGSTHREALAQVGIHRRVFDYWSHDLRDRLEATA